jgi:tryptophan halogenase
MKIIKDVVIVGAGSSSMLAAAYIANNTSYNITIVDKPGGSPIGVGEATLVNFEPYMKACGFMFEEWFDACDATYKTGILFPGWTKKEYVWHPFHMNPMASIEELKLDRFNGFHIDCLKLVKFIKKKLKVNYIEDEVIKLEKNILHCKKQKIKADVFIDCTGFSSVLQKEKTIYLKDRLICDTAIAGPVQYQDVKERKNHTICEAVSCGWIWKVPVKTRIGTGIVFNRKITPIKEAEKIFLSHWNNRPKIAKVINWTPYYKKSFWKDNVIRIGLSAGFIEPLESTGLALAMEGAYQFVHTTRSGYYDEDSTNIYNSIIKSFFEDCIDFIGMHYIVNNRKEEFWKKARKLKMSNKQKYYINKTKEPINYPNNLYSFFGGNNWVTWLKQI